MGIKLCEADGRRVVTPQYMGEPLRGEEIGVEKQGEEVQDVDIRMRGCPWVVILGD